MVCGKVLGGRQKKYCSFKCNMKHYNSTPSRKSREQERQYRRNKYVKKPGDKVDRKGSKNPNWKGGISKDNMRYKRRFVKNNPEKVKAEQIASAARRRGFLIPEPCTICGALKVDAHHPDYSKPLEVVWLCRKHHILVDRGKINI
jgi:hypothetical protein